MSGVYYRGRNGLDDLCTDVRQSLGAYPHCLVNPGSVGQPREDQGTAARYALYDPVSQIITLQQVPYDVQATVAAMRDFKLPDVLAQRLLQGI